MDCFLSTILVWPLNWAPYQWANCDGRSIQVNQNTALYSLLGNQYGGNSTAFNIPDLRGRLPLGYNGGSSLYPQFPVGKTGGNQAITLTVANMPVHNHPAQINNAAANMNVSTLPATESVAGTNGATTLAAPYDTANQSPIAGYVDSAPNIAIQGMQFSASGLSIGNNGGSQPFDPHPPYQVVNYIIALAGIYPTRD